MEEAASLLLFLVTLLAAMGWCHWSIKVCRILITTRLDETKDNEPETVEPAETKIDQLIREERQRIRGEA